VRSGTFASNHVTDTREAKNLHHNSAQGNFAAS
jgi:hypothetical protein